MPYWNRHSFEFRILNKHSVWNYGNGTKSAEIEILCECRFSIFPVHFLCQGTNVSFTQSTLNDNFNFLINLTVIKNHTSNLERSHLEEILEILDLITLDWCVPLFCVLSTIHFLFGTLYMMWFDRLLEPKLSCSSKFSNWLVIHSRTFKKKKFHHVCVDKFVELFETKQTFCH